MCEEELENVEIDDTLKSAMNTISDLQAELDEQVINLDTSLIKIDTPERLQ